MNRIIKYFSFFTATSLLLIGCFGSSPPKERIRFYTLEYPPPVFSGMSKQPCIVQIKRFTINSIYNTTRIIFQSESSTRDDYVYHRWRVNPADMVTQLLKRDLMKSGVLAAVLDEDSRFSYTHTLEGSVDEFLELDSEDAWYAVLTVSITIMKADCLDIVKGILMQNTYSAKTKLKKKNPRDLAEAMSRAMAEVSERIIRDLHASVVKQEEN
ncbi:ABC-type transport auxiliary lipoprotein family protein [Thermodesulfobacteriota bacterium]